jgi:alpha-glucuronidase
MKRAILLASALLALLGGTARAEDGYDLWLRYPRVSDPALLAEYRGAATEVVLGGDSPTLRAARDELVTGLTGLLGAAPAVRDGVSADGAIVVGTPRSSALIRSLVLAAELRGLGREGYLMRTARIGGRRMIVVAANEDIGALYGTFALLRRLQMHQPVRALAVREAPKVALRVLNHWDNLDGSVERGYAGRSIWRWDSLPSGISPRYRDYARANASIGINGAVLTNVNANARVLTPEYLEKVSVVAGVLRPYGVRVYLTARFSAPIELGGLKTADPLDPAVRQWWKQKIDEIYAKVPDFGGFVVKANSEGQPGAAGLQAHARRRREHVRRRARPAWRRGDVARVRVQQRGADRPREAGVRRVQAARRIVPRERPGAGEERPVGLPAARAVPSPVRRHAKDAADDGVPDHQGVSGGRTPTSCTSAPTGRKCSAPTRMRRGRAPRSPRSWKGRVHPYARTGIAGVSNVGSDRNWTGSQFNQANWYAFGRLAWNPEGSARAIADEWIRMTFTNSPSAVAAIRSMLLQSREAVVNYMTPLGLAHIMATGHHYGPAPWVRLSRADWSPTYYHRADTLGVGFDRTPSGSNAVAQYAPQVRDRYANRATVPDSVLLFFHHVPWTYRTHTGRTVWDELVFRYNAGVDTVRAMQKSWASVRPAVDADRFTEVAQFLEIQEREARWWRDAALTYFQQFSRLPIPAKYEQPAHPLAYYQQIRCPADRDKPRCDAIP